MSDEIKPCKNCGSQNVKFGFVVTGWGNFGILCEDCGYIQHEKPIQSKDEMIAEWNRRADDGHKSED